MFHFLACPTSIKGTAITNYVFVSSVVKIMFVVGSSDCLIECYKETRCKSVNFYPARRLGDKKNVCELNEASQIYNPNSMQQYTGATYYENIECAGGKENQQQKSQSKASKLVFSRLVGKFPQIMYFRFRFK